MPCLGHPPSGQVVALPESQPATLLVVIDTEEEFDWSGPFSRHSVHTSAMHEIGRAQQLFDRFGITPTYVIDYPIATDMASIEILREFSESGRATIGAHLHSWVNPPFSEAISAANSYQGNLPPGLELEKLRHLLIRVEAAFGARPIVHKAGRYGLGDDSARNLEQVGVEIDLSFAPAFDYRLDGGPDYRHYSARPQRLGQAKSILELPCTGCFIGPLRALGPTLYRVEMMRSPAGRALAGLLSKARLLERIMLSPEGHSLTKLKRLTRALHRRGHRVFTFSFHSPTLKSGCTPYTNSPDEVDEFLIKCRDYFEFFLRELGGSPTTPVEVQSRLVLESRL